MKLIVVSDTHRDREFIKYLVNQYPDATMYLHAGDSELSSEELFPFLSVKGNCDYFIENKYREVKLNGVNIYMFHGDHFPLDLDFLHDLASNKNCNVIIHGHTHIPYYNFYKGVHIICPGSTTYPRVTRATYCVITFNNYSDIKVEFKNYGC